MATKLKINRKDLEKFLPDQRSVRVFEQLLENVPDDLSDLYVQVEKAQEDADSAGALAQSALDTANSAESTANSASSTAVSANAKADLALLEVARLDLASRGFHFVSSLEHLPDPVSGVIYLEDYDTYWFTRAVDLSGSRIVAGRSSAILGSSSENSVIKSTGLDSSIALISSEWTIPIRHISFSHGTIFDLDASANANQAIDWYGVNIVDCDNIGTIKSYSNFVAISTAIVNSKGLVFDGTFGSIVFEISLISTQTAGVGIDFPSTLTIERRIRLTNSVVISNGTATGINASISAVIPVEGYVFDTVNFSGTGAYTSGVTYNDNKSRWLECRGVNNSASLTGYYMTSNATATVISSTSTPVKAAGATTQIAISQRFTVAATNRATYTGAISRDFKIILMASLTSGNNNRLAAYIYKNGVQIPESKSSITANSGGRAENLAAQCISSATDLDYFEVWVENISSTNNITVEDLNLTIEALN